MAGLVLLVARAGMIDVGEAIESEFAVALEAFGRVAAVYFFVGFVTLMHPHGIDQATPARDLLKRCMKKSAKHAVLKRLVEIADLPKLFFDVALFDLSGKSAQRF